MIYLDNSATTFPKPVSVQNALLNAVKNYGGNPGRSGHFLSLKVSEKIYDTRLTIATLFNTTAENVVFTSNCTHALNTAIKGILNSGDHIILSDLEHNSVIRPIYALSKQKNVSYDIATTYMDKKDTVNSFKQMIRNNTKAIVCTHASNVTGFVLPIREIGLLCKEKNITFIVDVAQSAGVFDIDVKAFNIDILCSAGHKGLYGPTGTGFMIIENNIKLNTLLEGGTGSLSVDLTQPDFSPDRYESGTQNSVGIIALQAGALFVKNNGINKIYKHEFSICEKIYNNLSQMKSVKLYTDNYCKNKYSPIVICNVNDINSNEIISKMSNLGYCLRGGLHCSPLAHKKLGTLHQGVVRISPSAFTNNYEVNKFLNDFYKLQKNII